VPLTKAVAMLCIKKDTSLPTCAPILLSCLRFKFNLKRLFNAIKVAAASLEPPPNPALSGIFFNRLVVHDNFLFTKSLIFSHAFVIKFSSLEQLT